MAVVIAQFQYNTEKGKEMMTDTFHNPNREIVTQQNRPMELVQCNLILFGDITKLIYIILCKIAWISLYCDSKREIGLS